MRRETVYIPVNRRTDRVIGTYYDNSYNTFPVLWNYIEIVIKRSNEELVPAVEFLRERITGKGKLLLLGKVLSFPINEVDLELELRYCSYVLKRLEDFTEMLYYLSYWLNKNIRIMELVVKAAQKTDLNELYNSLLDYFVNARIEEEVNVGADVSCS